MLPMSIATTRIASRRAGAAPTSQYAASSAVRPSTWPSSPCSPDRSKKQVCHLSASSTYSPVSASVRRSVKARGHFPTEQAALKHLYLVIISLDPTGGGWQRWSNRWKAALNAFDITFDVRFSAGRK
jgi:hypothetical protein